MRGGRIAIRCKEWNEWNEFLSELSVTVNQIYLKKLYKVTYYLNIRACVLDLAENFVQHESLLLSVINETLINLAVRKPSIRVPFGACR